MPFIRPSGKGNLGEYYGAGGMAGEGAAVSDGRGKTTAGTPDAWYNIQDFLGANPQTPAIASRIQERGGEQLSKAADQLEQTRANIQELPTPVSYSKQSFDDLRKDGITQDEASNIAGYLDQTVANKQAGTQLYEQSPEIQFPDPYGGQINQDFSSMKPGEIDSIMNWFGPVEQSSSQYTPGMQKMDEMLLRNQTDFLKQFPTQMQQNYQQQVTDPIQAARTEIGAKQEQAKKDFEQQRTDWTQGISSFLQGEDQKIQDLYQQQQQQLDAQNKQNLQDITGQYYDDLGFIYSNLGSPYVTKALGEFSNPAMRYITRENVVDPSLDTAAVEYFTNPQDYADYNTLSGLIDYDNQYDLSAQPFNVGAYDFDVNRMAQDYRNKALQIEQDKARQRVEEILGSDPFVYDWGGEPTNVYDVPLYWDTKYGRIMNEMAEAGQRIKPPAAQINYQY